MEKVGCEICESDGREEVDRGGFWELYGWMVVGDEVDGGGFGGVGGLGGGGGTGGF